MPLAELILPSKTNVVFLHTHVMHLYVVFLYEEVYIYIHISKYKNVSMYISIGTYVIYCILKKYEQNKRLDIFYLRPSYQPPTNGHLFNFHRGTWNVANSMPRSMGFATCHPGRNSTGGGNGPSGPSGWFFLRVFQSWMVNYQRFNLEDHPSGSK